MPVPEPPPEVGELVELIGQEATFKLIEQCGGTRVHVPAPTRTSTSVLQRVIGDAALRKLAAAMPRYELKLPLCKSWLVQVYLSRGDRSHAEIALHMRVTESWVQRMATARWKPQRSTPGKLSRANTDQLPLPL